MNQKKSFGWSSKVIYFIVVIFFLPSCSQIEVNVTIKIKPFSENDHGKFWTICIDYDKVEFSDKPIAYFEILSKNSKSQECQIDFIHLKQKCSDKNVLVYFVGRHTPNEEWEWLKGLEAEDIEYVNVKIKRRWDENGYVYEKIIISEELK